MSSFTDLPSTEMDVMGLSLLGATLLLGMTMRRHCARVGMAGAVRLLGVMVLLGMLSACSAPTQEEIEAFRQAREIMEQYRGEVAGRLRAKWMQYLTQRPNDRAHGWVSVSLYVGTTGKMEYLHVKNNPNTDPVLTKLTVKAVQDTKLPPMPEEMVPAVKKFHHGRFEIRITFDTNRPEDGGVSAREGPRMNAETKKLMEKRWGMPPESREGNDRKAAQQVETKLPSSPPTKGGGASGGTQTTVKLTGTPKERYTQRVTQAVEKKWRIYLKLQMEGITYGSLKVNFYVNKQGKVEDPLVVDDKDSYRALTLLTLRAIKDAEIPPMPVDVFPLLPMNDPERLKIEYNVLIY